MSGHSKWSKIKRAKAANDAKKGKVFTKLARNITVAAQQGGGDPEMNFALRIAIDKAKAANAPSDNIQRAVKKGTGELAGGKITSVTYEGYGPGTVAMLINCQTDNTNRALSEVKQIMNGAGGKLSSEGSVAWQFEEKGVFVIRAERYKESEKFGKEGTYSPVLLQDMLLEIMEISGVEEIEEESKSPDGVEVVEVITSREDFSNVHSAIQNLGFKLENAELDQLAKETKKISKEEEEKLLKLIESLEDSDEVSSVWHNAE